MARVDKRTAIESGFSTFSKVLPYSALGSYSDIIREIYSLTSSKEPEVLKFRKDTITRLNDALTYCCDIAKKGKSGRIDEDKFWAGINHYREFGGVGDSIVGNLLEEMSSGISLSYESRLKALESQDPLNIERQGVRMAPHLNGELYQGALSKKWGNPYTQDLTIDETHDLRENLESIGAQE